MIWFMRMAKWVRNPPSAKMAILLILIVILCLAIGVFEYFWGWPEALTLDRNPRRLPRF